MPEVKFSVVPVGIQYLCDSCGNGYMIRQEIDSSFLHKTPPKYRHVCNNCWVEAYLTDAYPTIRYKYKEQFTDEFLELAADIERKAHGIGDTE